MDDTNTLGEKTKEIVKGNGKTAYQVLKPLDKLFTKSKETKKLELKKKLNELKFEEEQNINIFMADLQNTIEELEKIDKDLNTSIKVGILNRVLPGNLRFINVFQYNNDWKKCSNYKNKSNNIELIDNKNESAKPINKKLICWTIDLLGASINITKRLDKFTSIKYCNEKIFFANNQSIIINKVGTFIEYINEYEFTIEDDYYKVYEKNYFYFYL